MNFDDFLPRWNHRKTKIMTNQDEEKIIESIKDNNISSFLNSNISLERKIRILSKIENDEIISSICDYIFKMDSDHYNINKLGYNREIFLILYKEEDINIISEKLKIQLKLENIINPKRKEIQLNDKNLKLEKEIMEIKENSLRIFEEQKKENNILKQEIEEQKKKYKSLKQNYVLLNEELKNIKKKRRKEIY